MSADADRIAEIRARAEAATPGPWLAEPRPFAAGIQAWILTATTLPEEANSSAVFLPREDVEFVGQLVVAEKLADENYRAAKAEAERLRAALGAIRDRSTTEANFSDFVFAHANAALRD